MKMERNKSFWLGTPDGHDVNIRGFAFNGNGKSLTNKLGMDIDRAIKTFYVNQSSTTTTTPKRKGKG